MAVETRRSVRWSRRPAVAAIASVLAAMALAASMAGRGCRMAEDDPIAAVRAFAAAAEAEDHEALYELLGPASQARLEAAARRATDLAGGAHRFGAIDMLSIGKADGATLRDFHLVERDEQRAVIEFTGVSGERARLTVMNVNGAWRIELP